MQEEYMHGGEKASCGACFPHAQMGEDDDGQ